MRTRLAVSHSVLKVDIFLWGMKCLRRHPQPFHSIQHLELKRPWWVSHSWTNVTLLLEEILANKTCSRVSPILINLQLVIWHPWSTNFYYSQGIMKRGINGFLHIFMTIIMILNNMVILYTLISFHAPYKLYPYRYWLYIIVYLVNENISERNVTCHPSTVKKTICDFSTSEIMSSWMYLTDWFFKWKLKC